MSDESALKSKFMLELKQVPGFVALRHEDVRTAGIPDLSVTGHGRTTWWEFKHADPVIRSFRYQELTMQRLATAGFARYVIWLQHANGTAKRTLIVHPRQFDVLRTEHWCSGFDHHFVVDYMKQVHRA